MFGQLAGRSVFNTPTGFTHFRPIFGLLFENVVDMLTGHSFLAPPFFVAEQAAAVGMPAAVAAGAPGQRPRATHGAPIAFEAHGKVHAMANLLPTSRRLERHQQLCMACPNLRREYSPP